MIYCFNQDMLEDALREFLKNYDASAEQRDHAADIICTFLMSKYAKKLRVRC